MKTTNKILISVLGIFLAIPAVSLASEGTNSGGGGTTIESHSGRRILVDLYKFEKPRNSGITLKSRSLKNYRTDYLCVDCGNGRGLLAGEQKLSAFVKAKISTLAINFPKAASAIREELKTPMIVLLGEAPKLNAMSLSANVDLTEIPQELHASAKLAAYFESDKLVGISAIEFNRLSIEDQAGLLIHEAARTLQKQFERKITNREIQDLVLAIVSEDIQTQQKFSSQINSLTEVYNENKFDQVRRQACLANKAFSSWNFPNATELCGRRADQINLEMTLNAWKDVHSASAEMLRTAQTSAEVTMILKMVDNFESLFLMAATNALAPKDSLYSGIVRSGRLTMKLVDIDMYNRR